MEPRGDTSDSASSEESESRHGITKRVSFGNLLVMIAGMLIVGCYLFFPSKLVPAADPWRIADATTKTWLTVRELLESSSMRDIFAQNLVSAAEANTIRSDLEEASQSVDAHLREMFRTLPSISSKEYGELGALKLTARQSDEVLCFMRGVGDPRVRSIGSEISVALFDAMGASVAVKDLKRIILIKFEPRLPEILNLSMEFFPHARQVGTADEVFQAMDSMELVKTFAELRGGYQMSSSFVTPQATRSDFQLWRKGLVGADATPLDEITHLGIVAQFDAFFSEVARLYNHDFEALRQTSVFFGENQDPGMLVFSECVSQVFETPGSVLACPIEEAKTALDLIRILGKQL